jgi:hypothetical protein
VRTLATVVEEPVAPPAAEQPESRERPKRDRSFPSRSSDGSGLPPFGFGIAPAEQSGPGDEGDHDDQDEFDGENDNSQS